LGHDVYISIIIVIIYKVRRFREINYSRQNKRTVLTNYHLPQIVVII